jgi:hypothetical protein
MVILTPGDICKSPGTSILGKETANTSTFYGKPTDIFWSNKFSLFLSKEDLCLSTGQKERDNRSDVHAPSCTQRERGRGDVNRIQCFLHWFHVETMAEETRGFPASANSRAVARNDGSQHPTRITRRKLSDGLYSTRHVRLVSDVWAELFALI